MLLPLLLNLAAAAAQPTVPATQASAPVSDQARMIFEKDWVLMNWALKFYDSGRDILLGPDEAQKAAAAFREMADVNHDGRVTTDEYRAARGFILAATDFPNFPRAIKAKSAGWGLRSSGKVMVVGLN